MRKMRPQLSSCASSVSECTWVPDLQYVDSVILILTFFVATLQIAMLYYLQIIRMTVNSLQRF